MRILFAYFALLAFPFYAAYVFRRYSRAAAAAITVLVGALFLPENVWFDLPLIPPLGKDNVLHVSVLVVAFIYQRPALKAARIGTGPEALVFLMILGSVGTMLTNLDPIFNGQRMEDGLILYWLVAMIGDDILDFALPFVVGRALFRNMNDLETLMRAIVSIGLIYAGLVFVEVLLSIPFRSWFIAPYFYGTEPLASYRWGFVQPMVFVQHALELAGVMASAAIAAAALAKAKLPATRLGPKLSCAALFGSVVATRNVAGNLYGFSVGIAFLLLKPRSLVRAASLLVLLALGYPALRTFDLIPTDYLVAKVAEFDEERAISFAGRLGEEEFVISLDGGKRLFGWGDVARTPGALDYDFREGSEGGSEGGLDGWWTIMLAARGFVGMFAPFLLLGIPVLVARRRCKTDVPEPMLPLVAGLMFIVGIRMVDLLMNGWWNNLPMFLAGALMGVMSREVPVRRKFQRY